MYYVKIICFYFFWNNIMNTHHVLALQEKLQLMHKTRVIWIIFKELKTIKLEIEAICTWHPKMQLKEKKHKFDKWAPRNKMQQSLITPVDFYELNYIH